MRIRCWWIIDHCSTFNRIGWWFINTTVCYVWLKMRKIKVYENVKRILLLLTSCHHRKSCHFNILLLFVWLFWIIYDENWMRKKTLVCILRRFFYSQMNSESLDSTRKEQIKIDSFEFLWLRIFFHLNSLK